MPVAFTNALRTYLDARELPRARRGKRGLPKCTRTCDQAFAVCGGFLHRGRGSSCGGSDAHTPTTTHHARQQALRIQLAENVTGDAKRRGRLNEPIAPAQSQRVHPNRVFTSLQTRLRKYRSPAGKLFGLSQDSAVEKSRSNPIAKPRNAAVGKPTETFRCESRSAINPTRNIELITRSSSAGGG